MRWVFFLALVLLPLTIHAQGIRQVISLDSEYRNNETMVWTPSIQKCWDEMSIFYKLQNPTFEPPNLIDKELNAFQWSYDTTVPKASNFIMLAGTGEEYWRQANQLLQKHFGNSIPPFAIEDFGGREPDLGLVLVNVLKHSLTFNTQLSPITPPLIFRTRLPTQPFKKVESFGTLGDKRKEVAGQFEVIAYDPDKQRMGIVLEGKSSDEQVILISDPEIQTPQQAITTANRWLAMKKQNSEYQRYYNSPTDTIQIPRVEFSSRINFRPLLKGKIDRRIEIAAAVQHVELRLDRSGAAMVSKTFIVAPNFLSSSDSLVKQTQNRRFVFDRPFTLLIKREDATYPFFLCRVDIGALVPVE
ncbi:MAG: hypothetical protein AAF226_06675 [Verrucomicrobiota bacterium]